MPENHSPVVSVIIPCYLANAQQAAFLADTLESLAAQDFGFFEAIVVDDASPISVRDVIPGDGRFVFLSQLNAGSAVARNTGIASCKGDYLVFLDADDILLPHALSTGLQALATHPDAGFCVGPHEEMSYGGDPVPWQVPVPPPQSDIYLPLLAFDWYIIPPSCAMFKRQVVEVIGGFRDPWGSDDLDFYLRAAASFTAFCYAEPPVTRYRRYSASSSRDGERMLHSIRAVYDRQWPLVRGKPEGEAAWKRGLELLTGIFVDCLVENVQDRYSAGDLARCGRAAKLLATESPETWAALRRDHPELARLELLQDI